MHYWFIFRSYFRAFCASTVIAQLFVFAIALLLGTWSASMQAASAFNVTFTTVLLLDFGELAYTARRRITPPGTVAELLLAFRMGLSGSALLAFQAIHNQEEAEATAAQKKRAQDLAAAAEQQRLERAARIRARLSRLNLTDSEGEGYASLVDALSRASAEEVEAFFTRTREFVELVKQPANIGGDDVVREIMALLHQGDIAGGALLQRRVAGVYAFAHAQVRLV